MTKFTGCSCSYFIIKILLPCKKEKRVVSVSKLIITAQAY